MAKKRTWWPSSSPKWLLQQIKGKESHRGIEFSESTRHFPYLFFSPFLQEELKAENEKLKEKLRAKVWSMALATVGFFFGGLQLGAEMPSS